MPQQSFHTLVLRRFGFLREQYGFWGQDDTIDDPNCLRLEGDRGFVEFRLSVKDNEVSIYTGRLGLPGIDLSWVFGYLTRGLLPLASQHAPGLYYYPAVSLGLRGEEGITWQLERLAEILQPMWPAIFIFLETEGPQSVHFMTFRRRIEKTISERAGDGYRFPAEILTARAPLEFAIQVQKSFSYLTTYGFKVVYADPIFVRYENIGKPHTYINVFHYLRSFLVDLHTGWVRPDPAHELNFDMEELAGWTGAPYSPCPAHSEQELRLALNRLARQYRKHAAPLLAGDLRLLEALHTRRIDSAHRASRAWAERNRY
jgi:hypothetical protein